MIYLSGSTDPNHYGHDERVGFLMTPRKDRVSIPFSVVWGADPGTFGQDGPRDWTRADWIVYRALLRRLVGSLDNLNALFAAAPDRPYDAAATLKLSPPYFEPIRRLGYKVALVGQDGMTVGQLPWDDFDVLFIGGSTEWKVGPEARALTEAAKARGKGVHVGRVNTWPRLLEVDAWGTVDSVDGNVLAHNPGRYAEVITWLDLLESRAWPSLAAVSNN